MIEINRLTRRFGQITAVSEVSLKVRAGEIYGLLGPNGAGKTTLLHMVAGLDQPDGGEIRLDGVLGPPWSSVSRKRIGLVPQEAGFYPALTARENLQFWGAITRLSRLRPYPLRSGRSRRNRVRRTNPFTGSPRCRPAVGHFQ
jgi:ABC-2 type transport system ATP-binding protein